MFRNTITILLCLLSFVAATAQTATGWYKYPTFNDRVDNMIQTPERIYYRSGTNLFSYGEKDNENFAFSTDNYLSDVNVAEIYYNAEKKFLAVTYDNGNIDLLFDDGRNINLPEIKNANVFSARTINDVTFDGDNIYVATGFGYVVYDSRKLEVKESAVFNQNVQSAVVVDGNIVIYHDGAYKAAPLSSLHNRLENFTLIKTSSQIPAQTVALGKSKIGVRTFSKLFYSFEISNPDTEVYFGNSCAYPVRSASDGKFYTSNGDYLTIVDKDLTNQRITLPDALKSGIICYYSTPDVLWNATADGLAKFNIDGTMLSSRILPVDCISVPKVNIMKWSPDHERLYLSRMSPANGRPGGTSDNNDYQITNVIESRVPRDVSLKECSLYSYWGGTYYQELNKDKRLHGGFAWLCENPYDKDMYFINSDWNGVLAAKDNKMFTSFTPANTPYNSGGYASRSEGVFIDPQNNLWVQILGVPCLAVLPAEHLKPENILNVKSSDWTRTAVEGKYGEKNFTMLFSTHSNLAYIFNQSWSLGLVAYDTKGTYADATDDASRQWTSTIDQDGKTFSPTQIFALAEDQNGHIWVGTASGVCIITDPAKGLDDDFRVRRPKVGRNDGTTFADYLIESDAVLWISVDPANNKWLATQNSGLYLVNPDGTQILAHYEKGNSPLTTNTIYTVEQDPYSNLVYVGTDDGLYSFYCATAPAADDYSEIYAYPNPVRPDYTGLITISGLTEGSLVKIMDASGALVAQSTANGGLALWDGCNMNGQRVRSGVYYVFASSGAQAEQGSGAVTKIIVIN